MILKLIHEEIKNCNKCPYQIDDGVIGIYCNKVKPQRYLTKKEYQKITGWDEQKYKYIPSNITMDFPKWCPLVNKGEI